MLNPASLSRHFDRIGARFKTSSNSSRGGWALDITRDRNGPIFELRGSETALAELEALVSNVDRTARHLLLFVRARPGASLNRFLCGHDERQWFVATVPGRPSTVVQAMEILKPGRVAQAQQLAGLKPKQRHRRHNPAFLRQGEWFFVPTPALDTGGCPIHRWEPIRRGRGKAHMVEEVVRLHGKAVYVNGSRTITPEEYDALRRRVGYRNAGFWQPGVRDAKVYARGKVRHPDHATLHLDGWHEVLANTEAKASPAARRRLAFID